MELKWKFQRGGTVLTKKPSMGGVWILFEQHIVRKIKCSSLRK